MRVRKLAAVSIVTTAMLMGPVTPANAAGVCPYPPANPRLSLNASQTLQRVGQKLYLGGWLTRNGCGIAFQRVGLFFRHAPGVYRYRGQMLTNSRGQFQFIDFPGRTTDYIMIFSGSQDYGRTLSNLRHISVTG